jgi:hypothetical protein
MAKKKSVQESFYYATWCNFQKSVPFMKTEVRNKSPCDLRGTARTLRHNVFSGEYLRRIHEFVESLPTKQVQCSNNVSKKVSILFS